MSIPPVFCPNCGTQNLAALRFCTRCGTNLEAVSKVLTKGSVTPEGSEIDAEVSYAQAISRKAYKFLSSLAFFLVMFFIFDQAWWTLFLLFWVADPLKDIIHLLVLKNTIPDPVARKAAFEARKGKKKKKKKEKDAQAATTGEISANPQLEAPSEAASVASGVASYDFASQPPSVTEGTTRHLEETERPQPRYVPPAAH
jgi:hypothetical protein